jgi:hypothetical protein
MPRSALFGLLIILLLILASLIFLIPGVLSASRGGRLSTSPIESVTATKANNLTQTTNQSTTSTTRPIVAPKPDPALVKANGYLLSTPVSMLQWNDSMFSSLVQHLIACNVTYLFFNLANMNQNGAVDENFTVDTLLILRFNNFSDLHSFQYIAWTGTQNNPNALLSNFTTAAINQTVASAYKAGFDGFLIDIEPVPNGSPQFLTMLQDFKAAVNATDPALLIGANSMNLNWWEPYGRLWMWDTSYFQNVTSLVSFVSPMLFESGMTTPAMYQQFLIQQTALVAQFSKAPVIYEIPDWYGPNTTWHFPLAENISNAINAFQKYMNLSSEGVVPPLSKMLGLAIYGLNKTYTLEPGTVSQALETRPSDWSLFVTQWVEANYSQKVGTNITYSSSQSVEQ